MRLALLALLGLAACTSQSAAPPPDVALPAIPMLANGKPDRVALRGLA